MRQVTVNELNSVLEKVNVIDVREDYEYVAGHVPGSVNMPLSTFGQTYTNLDKGKEYYIICQSGARSMTACDFLEQLGYTAINVIGGTGIYGISFPLE